jgi:hypothetical protein
MQTRCLASDRGRSSLAQTDEPGVKRKTTKARKPPDQRAVARMTTRYVARTWPGIVIAIF